MSDVNQALETLKELFPNYSDDLILGVMETMGSLEGSIEALFSLGSTSASPPSTLSSDFLDVGGPEDVTDEVNMQRQIEQIIRESRLEEAKGNQPKSLSWKEKLKNVFKKKAKPAAPPAAKLPPPQSQASAPPEEDEDDEEIITFKTAEDPRNVQGARYRQLPGKEDIELTAARKT